MVVFTCEACNESLKKNKVEAHLYTCRRSRYVTCIDCQVDFDRQSYKQHTSCISEMEKYGAPGYVPKASANKGAKKQDDWFQRVQSAIDSCSSGHGGQQQLSRVLYRVRESANVPRKQAKFVNFCRNSMKWASPAVIQQAWSLLAESATPASSGGKASQTAEAAASESADDQSKKRPVAADDEDVPAAKKKKQQQQSSDSESVQPTDEAAGQSQQKKRKKHKRKDDSAEEAVAAVDAAAVDNEAIDVEKKRKKKKKQKHELTADEDETTGAAANGHTECPEPVAPQGADGDCGQSEKQKKKKKKKKQKHNRDEESQQEALAVDDYDAAANGHTECPEPEQLAAADDDRCDGAEKKKKKRKKKKQKETASHAGDENGNAVCAN